jgi:hypothetical protein
VSSKTSLNQTLQIETGVLKTSLNDTLQRERGVLRKIPRLDTTNRERCPKSNPELNTTNRERGVLENISESHITNRERCHQEQLFLVSE